MPAVSPEVIVSEEVVVRGTVSRSIRQRKILLQSESWAEGDLYHKIPTIEQGAYFEGKSRRLDDPSSTYCYTYSSQGQPAAPAHSRDMRVHP